MDHDGATRARTSGAMDATRAYGGIGIGNGCHGDQCGGKCSEKHEFHMDVSCDVLTDA